MVKQYPLLGLFIPYRRRPPHHWPIVVQKSCDFRSLLFLLIKRNALEKSTEYYFNPVTFYWSTWTKPGGIMYMCARDIEFTYFYDFSIECWNCSDNVIYIFSFYYRLWKNPSWVAIVKKNMVVIVFRNWNRQNEIQPNWYQMATCFNLI